MPLKFVVMGFRHGHINDIVNLLADRTDAVLVGACEEDATTRAGLLEAHPAYPIFDSYERLLADIDCDVVAVGDYYGRRGAIAIEALKHGKHVLSDKPVCTSLDELDQIEKLLAQDKRSLGAMFDTRGSGLFLRLRRLIREADIGAVHAISFNGQHPLMFGKRAGWYFEEGKHGGTINDIAVHAFDYIPWLTGLNFKSVNAARNWNAKVPQAPHFKDAAQFMLTMDNGCGVLGDVSYLTPDSFGYTLPHYWRTTVWGDGGMAELSHTAAGVTLYQNGQTEARHLEPDPAQRGSYFDDFVAEVSGLATVGRLDTAAVLRASRIGLQVQKAADDGACNVAL